MNDIEYPSPLTPPGSTMRGNDWFPLKFQRLRRSRWWRRASDLARARNVMLWGEAYQAVPAGSLPDDDDDLAEAAGFGMNVDAFIAVKAEIMAPWVLCSDGRWYHPTVCECVNESLELRRAAAAKKAGQRSKTVPGDTPSGPGDTAKCPGDIGALNGDVSRCPSDSHMPSGDTGVPLGYPDTASRGRKGDMGQKLRDRPKKRGDIRLQTDRQTDKERKKEDPPTPLGGDDALFAKIWLAYPESGKASTDQHRVAAPLAAARDEIGAEQLLDCVNKFAASEYARHSGGSKVPGLHLWLSKGRWRNWLATPGSVGSPKWPGPAAIRETIIAHVAGLKGGRAAGEAFVASWLDAVTTWSEVPPAIVCRSTTVEKRLRDMLGALLETFGVAILCKVEVAA